MGELNVGGSYLQKLESLQPQQFNRLARPGTFQIQQPFIAPPLNTDIRFGQALPAFTFTQSYKTFGTRPFPQKWDWRNTYPEDDDVVKAKKKNITKVPNQGLCGSCWAVAVAGMISDLFVVSGIEKINPEISSTFSLSCYPQFQCRGGNPATTLVDIQRNGIGTDKCVDYSWCTDDPGCSGKGAKHFNAGNETLRLNSIIPKCGCNEQSTAAYYVKNPSTLNADDGKEISSVIKSHIFNIGPVIGGYHVFRNFMSGDFTATGGVYFESYDYENDQWTREVPKWTGSHAVVVLGWGVSDLINIPLPDGRAHEVNVPYWYCRNSWGEKWGIDSGYFRIAMYPFNKLAQFERTVIIRPENALSGGFMLCEPDRKEITNKYGQVVYKATVENFVNNDRQLMYTWILIVFMIILIVVSVYIVIKAHKK